MSERFCELARRRTEKTTGRIGQQTEAKRECVSVLVKGMREPKATWSFDSPLANLFFLIRFALRD